jgi:hypothetical protein
MKIKPALFVAILAGLAMTGWLYLEGNAYGQSQANLSESDLYLAELLTNAPPPGFATRLDYLKSFTSQKDILDAYQSGKLLKGEAEIAMEMDKVLPGDKASMDTYGKVVDQDGQPVVGAKVRGFLEFEDFDKEDTHDTMTDALGRFKFLGLHAKGLAMVPEKEGYEFNSRILSNVNRSANYLPVPNNPLVFTMWKLRGAEPMKHIQINTDVPCDGNVKRFDLLSNEQRGSGDLQVTLTRDPLTPNQGSRRKPFNWTATFAITNGGLVEIPTNTIYPYEAPAEGYQSVIIWNYPTNMVGWESHIKRSFYFKSQNGQVYGRMSIEIWAGGKTPDMAFNADIYVNPNGSRNLEFDSSKQITR